ncbi:MAG: ATP-binding protein [Phormidesmis sp.]
MSRPLNFTSRIARSFLLLALLTVMMVGTVAFIQGRRALKASAYARLEVTANLKQNEISRWLHSCEEDFALIAEFPTVRQEVRTLLNELPTSAAYESAYQRLYAYFTEVSAIKPKFTEISLQNLSNQIILSTNPDKLGQYIVATNLTEVALDSSNTVSTPSFYVSPETGKPIITYASKIYDSGQNRQGMILANLKLARIDSIVSDNSDLEGTTLRTYLVGSLGGKTAFISKADDAYALPESDGITAALRGESGQKDYQNYEGNWVLGVYHWLADQNVALLSELDRGEALAPAQNLAGAIALIGSGAAAILFVGVSRLARQLSQSRRQIERYSQQLEQTAAAANSANQAKSEFLANMSHELRTPLNAILGFAQLMQRERRRPSAKDSASALSASHADYLDIISRSGEHLLNLINDVLSMAKIESGRTPFDPVSFDLHDLLRTLEEMLRMRAEAKALQLFVEVGAAVPQFIKTDEGKLRQVLVNLVGNAIKFTQAGHVTLQVSGGPVSGGPVSSRPVSSEPVLSGPVAVTNDDSPESHAICIRVKDTGPGIPPADFAHLFDPFYQAARTRKTQQGTGLGLAISQRFVGLMGGEISVQTVLEQGSIFSFCIQAMPAELEDLPSRPIGEVLGLAAGQPQYRILVVEDIFSSRRLLVDLLSLVGFEVEATPDGKEAIARAQTWHPHLIWMDMRMPVMDGYEATRQIRLMDNNNNSPGPKIIALTANAFEEERAAVLASGCDDLVRKPFRTHTIFEKMAEHLGVKYVYADDPAKSNTLPAQALQPEDLAVLSTRWRSRFHQAALEIDAETLQTLIEQIPLEHQHLRPPLLALIQTFGFDELLELSKTYA